MSAPTQRPALIVYIALRVGGSLTYYGDDEDEWAEIMRIRGALPLSNTFHAWKVGEHPPQSADELSRAIKFDTLAEFKVAIAPQ